MTPGDLVSVGVITGAHGVKGEVKLRSFTASPEAIATYALETGSGERIEIVKLRPRTDGFIAVLKNVMDRDAAEALKGTELFVPRERLAAPEAGEVYLRDLIGLDVWHGDKKLGNVLAVPNYGAGDLLEVKIEGRKDTVLIPFSERFVVSTDLEGGKIVVDLPDGFLDEG
ncbi:MAG: 16S rRNA processing protein RimM [Rhizobiales bacterium]|nr:16S rRNA processing protein RimM [Hyphomicrobiales bacterium]